MIRRQTGYKRLIHVNAAIARRPFHAMLIKGRKPPMNVADTMSGSVITIAPDKTVADAAELMLRHKISGLPVVDARGALIGIITEGDLLRRAETGTARWRARRLELLTTPGRLAQDYAVAHARRVAEVMTTDVATVLPEEPLENAVRLMERRRIKRLPVVEDGRLVGIVSRADLVRALLRLLPKAEPSKKPGDDDIRQNIMAEIDRQRWAPRALLAVDVKGGVVDLSGCITTNASGPRFACWSKTSPASLRCGIV